MLNNGNGLQSIAEMIEAANPSPEPVIVNQPMLAPGVTLWEVIIKLRERDMMDPNFYVIASSAVEALSKAIDQFNSEAHGSAIAYQVMLSGSVFLP